MDDTRISGGAPPDSEVEARRAFLKRLAVAGATVPAVALLLSAPASPAQAQTPQTGYGGGCGCGCGCG